METKKISKWDAATKSVKTMYELLKTLDAFNTEKLVSFLEDILDDYNKLEAKHQLDCGLISDYAEENAMLKQKAEHFNTQLDNLREKLREMERSRNTLYTRYADMSDICSRDEDDYEMLQAILRKDGYTIEYDGDIDDETIRCQDAFNISKETTQDEVTYQYGRWTLRRPWNFSEAKANADAAILRGQIISRDRKISELKAHCDSFNESNNDLRRRLLDLRCQLDDNGISSYWSSSMEANILDFSKHDVSARAVIADILKEKVDILKEEKIMLASKNKALGMEICEHNKQIHELKKKFGELDKIDELKVENKNLKQTLLNILETLETKVGLCRVHLLDSYEDRANLIAVEYDKLEKENEDLKDMLENDGEFGKNIGKRVADSIREGCDKGVYKLHPCTKIDIHVEETNNMPMTFDRHAIPRIAVIFNNTQTEIERDTAEHECEELNKKIEELKKENDELKVENNNLTTDNRRLNDAVDSWRKENKKLKDMVKSLRRTVNILDEKGYF